VSWASTVAMEQFSMMMRNDGDALSETADAAMVLPR
jgi:hypothetical protein